MTEKKIAVTPIITGVTAILFFTNCQRRDYIIIAPMFQGAFGTILITLNLILQYYQTFEIFFQIFSYPIIFNFR